MSFLSLCYYYMRVYSYDIRVYIVLYYYCFICIPLRLAPAAGGVPARGKPPLAETFSRWFVGRRRGVNPRSLIRLRSGLWPDCPALGAVRRSAPNSAAHAASDMRGAQECPTDMLLAGLAEIARSGFPLAATLSSTAGGAWMSERSLVLAAARRSATGRVLMSERR